MQGLGLMFRALSGGAGLLAFDDRLDHVSITDFHGVWSLVAWL